MGYSEWVPFRLPPLQARAVPRGRLRPCACRLAARLAEIEAEEAAGKRKLVIDEFRFSNPEFEAFYSKFDVLSPSRRSWQALRFSEPGKERRILVLAGPPLG
jgi:hypothetical protein